jgi:TPR repeat protein
MWARRRVGLLCAGLLCSLATLAAPADDHARALGLLQRGDVVGAMTALRAPAAAGHAPSMSLLGFINDRADMTEEAARWWREAAAKGDADAHVGLANLHLAGRGLAKDEKQALQHFSEAAALGHAGASAALAEAWLNGQLGLDAAARPQDAVAAWQRAASQGHVRSAEALVLAYREGRHGLAPDAAQAAHWQAQLALWRAPRPPAAASAPPGAKR